MLQAHRKRMELQELGQLSVLELEGQPMEPSFP